MVSRVRKFESCRERGMDGPPADRPQSRPAQPIRLIRMPPSQAFSAGHVISETAIRV